MADIYVGVGPMDYNSDTSKVALKYAVNAKDQMRDAAKAAIKAQAGFTLDKVGSSRQYDFDATLTEVLFTTKSGQPAVTCKLTAVLSTPSKYAAGKNEMVSGKILGTATLIGGTTDRDVADCIAAAVTRTVNDSVIPGIKEHMKKNP